jgi:DNA-binding XRE family transcriptional regulator
MGQEKPLTVIMAPPARQGALPPLPPDLKRTRPRDYVEWKTLRRWGKLPPWEGVFPGYVLRAAREEAGLTIGQMAERLGCSQDEIVRLEQPQSSPTVSFLKEWSEAVGGRLEISLTDIKRS